ncbi:DEAD/DEAH box helicase [Hyphomonas sp. CACIAM 19H1]|uniref:DEAD/DEAH box helicase n=1 Tax=Hyphomonas sp. CACIAM 19H1 TaxID=1873716 RepID=UPI0013B04C0E|nr:DEAD/DEAH box helicase [Hyphomonas sp. CACIAM 19H1]
MKNSDSGLEVALSHLSTRSARAVVARSRLSSPGLNQFLLSKLAAPAGANGSFLADPVFEAARTWKSSGTSLDALSGKLLAPALVQALDSAGAQRMPRDRAPYAHQLAAWEASLGQDKSVLVTAGTGAGKTECFLIPILQDVLDKPLLKGGVRAILLYPLNALIESQRERLAAWVSGLGGKVRFALYNGDTPESEREAIVKSSKTELRSREAIRKSPPEILVTNITMLEYLLLRSQDRAILEASQGALRWIVLDEAHTYVGSQAAEMALLLRRVRSAFGVKPENVRLMATSATIGGELNASAKLRSFTAALSGRPEEKVEVVEGQTEDLVLPPPGPDVALEVRELATLSPEQTGALLSAHPRLQTLRRELSVQPVSLTKVAQLIFDDSSRRGDAYGVLNFAARATRQGQPLMPWRAHVFQRAQGGVWACPDKSCPHRSAELLSPTADWNFGAVYLSARSQCDCGAPVYELVSCTECGTTYLQGKLSGGVEPRFESPSAVEGDDFALDGEPDEDDAATDEVGEAWLAYGAGIWLDANGRVWDNAAPDGSPAWPFKLFTKPEERRCCANAGRVRLQGLRFGPAFLMGATLPGVLEDLAPPMGESGLPANGRRALTFSDSRQGVARLAAKLQQEAERTLTRSFLWHLVQEGKSTDSQDIATLNKTISALRAVGEDELALGYERQLATMIGDNPAPIPWSAVINRFSAHADLEQFAGEVWKERRIGGNFASSPQSLARAFIFRELFRRPRVQNNPETMGLLRLSLPKLEDRAKLQTVPMPLREAGLTSQGWTALALMAVDRVFRNNFAVHLHDPLLSSIINPRRPGLRSIFAADMPRESVSTKNAMFWPTARKSAGRMSGLVETIYTLTKGDPDSKSDQDRTEEVLQALWSLITTTAAIDAGQGAYRLDLETNAAVIRLDHAWICPVTRRPYGYSLDGLSPTDPTQEMVEVSFPRLKHANAGGLTPHQRAEVHAWCETNSDVAQLRERGLWSDLHDRLASFAAFIRAQEHSAQIARPVLQRYEDKFREGDINLLNCSTTMEMGVDIADVRLVVNGNVPPALSNYRQRAGRAGRRGDPWAFTLTYCRDLPLDRRVFDNPAGFLSRAIAAPKVWFDSARLVQRHVNAALLSSWFASKGGVNVRGSVGAFLGATEDLGKIVEKDNLADAFLEDLGGDWGQGQADHLKTLVMGTILAGSETSLLVSACKLAFDDFVMRWRDEYRLLLDGASAAPDKESKAAQALRAKRLSGEFLLGELARRGFTPAYGFPTDVVTFTNLAHKPNESPQGFSLYSRGTAARTLDQAIREYAPGSEVVIDGLVHKSEGILPAWEGGIDASRLEDLRTLWSCRSCNAFGLVTKQPTDCPVCEHPELELKSVLRPSGFLGATTAHVGYEYLAYVPAEVSRLSAQNGDWVAFTEGAGRMRTDASGQLASTSAGDKGGGYAICLDCGRADAMNEPNLGVAAQLPDSMRLHYPLFRGRKTVVTRDGYCSGSDNPQRIQRHVHLAQVTKTDVWEWQLPANVTEASALGLAAGLREALTERLGVESEEVAPSFGRSLGAANQNLLSIYLYDRAAGGAGLSARLGELEMLSSALSRAQELLDCPESCASGCPACILRPDLNQRDTVIDRPGALTLVKLLIPHLNLPESLRVFEKDSHLVGRSAVKEITSRLRSGTLSEVDVWLHGKPGEWDFGSWELTAILSKLKEASVKIKFHMPDDTLTNADFDLSRKLAVHGLSAFGGFHRTSNLPDARGCPIIVRMIDRAGRSEAIAVTSRAESAPGFNWGSGSASPLIMGQAPSIIEGPMLSIQKVVELSTGNAQLLWPSASMNGPVAEFGKRFWGYVAKETPLVVAAMKTVGVVSLSYSDRYLLQPYTLRLLMEVIRNLPSQKGAAISLRLGAADRPQVNAQLLHDGFPTDEMRRHVLCAMLSSAHVSISRKNDLPHHRAFEVELTDGRKVTILLDQGFGAWKVEKHVRHDFSAAFSLQAKQLMSSEFRVSTLGADCAPIAVTMK